jgi:membrane-associated phospholipid phosphatase
MRPAVSAFCLRVSRQIKNFNLALPYGLAAKNFMDRHSFNISGFAFLHIFDQPYNLFPSLHIAFRTILAHLYAKHTKSVVRWASHVWFILIGFSTLLTCQHHIVDITGGFALAAICFYLFRGIMQMTN